VYYRNVNKFCFIIALIIGVGAMLVIPSATANVAKASTCSFSFGVHGLTFTSSTTNSGACSSGAAVSQHSGAISGGGGSKSSCSSVSASQNSDNSGGQDSNGAVSCHSP